VLNCSYNAISALVQLPFGAVSGLPAAEQAMRDVLAECLAVARAEGVRMDLDAGSQYARIRRTIPGGQYSSMAQDFARGRATEIAHLNGAIVRRGAALGVATPVNQMLVALIGLVETRMGGEREAAGTREAVAA
ncbi:ketopantoate reductase family protein, partial [Burkholderia gladioli]